MAITKEINKKYLAARRLIEDGMLIKQACLLSDLKYSSYRQADNYLKLHKKLESKGG